MRERRDRDGRMYYELTTFAGGGTVRPRRRTALPGAVRFAWICSGEGGGEVAPDAARRRGDSGEPTM